ncbi:MAG: paraquat-inducible protein A [Syntrophobacterales bacterium]|jgi:paraquat-inducible protein A
MNSLIACHECDLLYELPPLPEGSMAKCSRCGAVLHRHKRNSLDRTLSWTIAGLILFALANAYPFLALKSEGLVHETTLITGVQQLYKQGMRSVAALVFLTSILFPFLQLAGILYLLLPLKFNRLPWWKPALVFRFIRSLQPWAMMEVFMVGILVSVVKLAKMASVVPGLALYSFTILIFVLAAVTASLDPHLVWDRLEIER